MTHIFDDLALNLQAFYTTPKCTSSFKEGRRYCLLSAFWKAIGFKGAESFMGTLEWRLNGKGEGYSTDEMQMLTDQFTYTGFSESVIEKWDHEDDWNKEMEREIANQGLRLMEDVLFAKFPNIILPKLEEKQLTVTEYENCAIISLK
jgi:hypothetical protein